jgi:tetratricopeptide (TPR) repeat protein
MPGKKAGILGRLIKRFHMFDRMIRGGKFFATRMLVFLLVLGGFLYFFTDHKKLHRYAGLTTISRLRPAYTYLADFADGKAELDLRSLQDQSIYLENVLSVIGEIPDALALLAYCDAYQGRTKEAERLLLRSIEKNPSFFWSYYTLGVLSYQAKDNLKAIEYLGQAVRLDPQLTLKFITTSRVYSPLVNDAGYTLEKFFTNLESGILDARRMLASAYFVSGKFADALLASEIGLRLARQDAQRAFFLYYAGASAVGLKDFSKALRYFDLCLRLQPQHGESLAAMSVILKRIGQEDLSQQLALKAKDALSSRGSALPRAEDFRIRVF